jgi:hypothetical protein
MTWERAERHLHLLFATTHQHQLTLLKVTPETGGPLKHVENASDQLQIGSIRTHDQNEVASVHRGPVR